MDIGQHIKELEDLKVAAIKELPEYYYRKQKDNQKKNHPPHIMDEGIEVIDTSGGKSFGEILGHEVEQLKKIK